MFVKVVALLSSVIILSAESGDAAEIIGGKEVKPHSLPYMALVQFLKLDKTTQKLQTHVCGGTLITSKWVLTAAHCAGKDMKVTLGLHSKKSTKEEKTRQKKKVIQQVIHDQYEENKNENDLMLLKLENDIKITKSVKPFTIKKIKKEPKAGKKCLVAGWGNISYKKEPSDVLKSTKVSIIDRKTCNSTKYYNQDPEINNNILCAVGKHNSGVWKGDSGGPLVCDGNLVGVTSFGVEFLPGVFMYLSKDRIAWINENIKK